MNLRRWMAALTRTAPPLPPAVPATPATAAPSPPAPPSWSRVEPIFSLAVALSPAERERLLDRECGPDARLRAEVASLLEAHDHTGIVDRPVDEMVTSLVAPTIAEGAARPPSLRMVSHYELIARLPGGGMGVIYRAHDVKLQRPVALKFLPPAMSADERAKARFLLEARAAAALDHRNVCTIHEIGETEDGHLFIAMPYYEGETLAERLTRGSLPVAEAVGIASQIAHGLAHAHERGSIHRDIKPANVMLTAGGVAKILDFGIVKQGEQGLTRTGVMIGTLPYMSPEQLRRDAVDARTDIWSLGVVLHEMLIGRRPFVRDDDHALRDAIVFSPPESLRALRPDLPQELCRLVSVALAKDPADRHQSAATLAESLDRLHAAVSSTLPSAVVRDAQPPAAPDGMREMVDTAQLLPGGERRHTTVVVCSLAGYAGLVERLPARDVEEAFRRLKQAAFEIVERHSGTVNEFGDERIVLLFGVPASLEDHCARAVRTAVELRALVQQWRASRPAARGLALHIAIDTGDAAVQRVDGAIVPYRVAGRPMTRAVNLCAHAGTDEILISPEGGRTIAPEFDVAAASPVLLPNEAAPFAPLRVERASTTGSRLEQLAQSRSLTAFTGRDQDLATLIAAYEEACAGRGRLVTITGEAGLGKSRLLLEFRRRIETAATTLLVGRCSAYGQSTPYLPWLDVLWQLLNVEAVARAGAKDGDVVERVLAIDPALERFAPLYLHLLSVPTDKYRLANPVREEQRQTAFQEAMVALLVAAAAARPGVLLLEDWHWVDPASHAVLNEAVALVSTQPLLMVATSRAGFSFPSHRDANLPIVLRPLDTSSTATVVRAVLGVDEAPGELIARLHDRTGGNPFFLEEIVHSLQEAGTITVAGREARLAGSLAALDLPATVQAVIRTRLDRLDLNARQVLRAASVVGRDFTRRVVERVVPETNRVAAALETLEAAGLVQRIAVLPEYTYRFRHVLTQEAAYAGLLEHQRAQLHGLVGAALEELDLEPADKLDRLAQHFSLAEQWPKAVRYALQSAERMLSLTQYLGALQVADRTREWVDLLEPHQRPAIYAEVCLLQERLCDFVGLRERQRQIIDEVIARFEQDGDRERLAEAYLRKGDLHTTLHQFDEARNALEKSLSLQRLLDRGAARALRSIGFLSWYQGNNAEALSWAEEALEMDRRDGNLAATVHDLHNLGTLHVSGGDNERARHCFEEALQLSQPVEGNEPQESELIYGRLNVLYSYGRLLTESGELERALQYLRVGAEWTPRFNYRHVTYFYTALGQVHLRRGEIATCLECYREAMAGARAAGYGVGLSLVLPTYGELLLGLGREQEAIAPLQEAAAICAEIQDRSREALAWSRLAVAHERLGDYPAAGAAFERERALRTALGDAPGEVKALEGLGRVARRHLPASVALRHYEEAIDLAGATGDQSAAARLGNAAGIIEWTRGRYVEALAHFERALALFEAIPDLTGAGLMMNSIAVTLGRLGRRAEARERLEAALQHHCRTGDSRLEGHALAELGDWYWDECDPARAADYYERSLQTRQPIGDLRGQGWMLQRLARVRAATGDRAAAGSMLTRATDLATQCSDEELMQACAELRRQAHS
jgi:tetratricopeptide (TPR) repeat protein/class 3 adenylate cyclase